MGGVLKRRPQSFPSGFVKAPSARIAANTSSLNPSLSLMKSTAVERSIDPHRGSSSDS